MAISMSKWLAMTNEQRVDYVYAGKITVKPVMGIRSDLKVNEDDYGTGFVQYRAYSRGILFGYGDTERQAIRDAYKNLSLYEGEVPKEVKP